MATDIVASLFGVTPEMYQQRQMAQADERALQYAQLTPFQQANYAISRGAYGLAGALGGALGAQDPQLQLISQRNAIARQIDYNNPASIMEGQRLLARVGDTVGALQLANVARDLEYKQAQTTQSLAAAGASRAQAAKSQAEIDKIDRQQRAFALLTGAKPAEAAAPGAAPAGVAAPAAMPEAAVPAAAVPGAQPLYSINKQSLAGLPDDIQNLIQIKLEDAARLRADTTDPQSARADLRLRQAEMLEEQAARTFLAKRPDLRRLTGEESKDAISQRKFNNPIYYTLSDSQRAAVDKEFDAASEKAQLAQAKQTLGFQFAPTAAAAAPAAAVVPAAAPAAVVPAARATAPAAAASTRASISQQIAELENRRKQFLALTEISDAKAEAEILGDRIKDLREQLKPTEIAKLEREIDQFRADGASDTDPRIKTRLDKIVKLSTPTSERFGTDREAISKEKFFKPFAELTQAQAAVVNAEFEERQGRKAEKGAAKFTVTQETEFAKQLGAAQGTRYKDAVSLRDNAISALNTFDQLSKLNDQGLISGSFATGRVGATNLLNTLGLISPADSATLARSENYQKVAGDAILATLGGKLGAGFSNEDRKFIQGLVPQLENSPTARRQLIDFMVSKNRAIVGETTRLIDYAENKRTLNGFVPSVPLPSGGGLQGLSDEELRRRYEAARKK